MGAAACGGKGFRGRAVVNGERPMGAARCRQQHNEAASPPPHVQQPRPPAASTVFETVPQQNKNPMLPLTPTKFPFFGRQEGPSTPTPLPSLQTPPNSKPPFEHKPHGYLRRNQVVRRV